MSSGTRDASTTPTAAPASGSARSIPIRTPANAATRISRPNATSTVSTGRPYPVSPSDADRRRSADSRVADDTVSTPSFDPDTYKRTTREQWHAAAEPWHRWGPTLEDWLS